MKGYNPKFQTNAVMLQHFVGYLKFLHFWNIDDHINTKKKAFGKILFEFRVLYQVIFKADSKTTVMNSWLNDKV